MHIGAGELGQRVSLEHRQQNVALGLLVSAFAVVSDFSCLVSEKLSFKGVNSKPPEI